MCARTDWPCARTEPHTPPRGCVHVGTCDDLGDGGKHCDETDEA